MIEHLHAPIIATNSCVSQQLIRADDASNVQPMVATTKEDFAKRLHEACDLARPPIQQGRGRRAELLRRVKKQGLDVSGESVRKWLAAESIPSMDSLRFIATALECEADWLLTGRASNAYDRKPKVTHLVTEQPTSIDRYKTYSDQALVFAGYFDKLSPTDRGEAMRFVTKAFLDVLLSNPDADARDIAELISLVRNN